MESLGGGRGGVGWGSLANRLAELGSPDSESSESSHPFIVFGLEVNSGSILNFDLGYGVRIFLTFSSTVTGTFEE